MSGSVDETEPTFEELENARLGGRTAAIAVIVLSLIGAATNFLMDAPIGSDVAYASDDERLVAAAGAFFQALVGCFVAWRFHVGKGFFAGIGLLLLLAVEFAARVAMSSFAGLFVLGLLIYWTLKAVLAANELRKRGDAVIPPDTFS